MRLGPHRRNVVVWSSSAGDPVRKAPRRAGRVRRMTRTGRMLTIVGLLWLVRVVRPRWRPLLAGTACTVAGIILRHDAWGAVLLPGLLLLAASVFVPAAPDQQHERLRHELAAYSTHAQRCDLEATLAQYPDAVTRELRDVLAGTPRAHGEYLPRGDTPYPRWSHLPA
jgi:hypothetical protein